MYSRPTRTRVHARISNGHPREENRASDRSQRTSGELNGPRAPRQADCRSATRADFRERQTLGEEVRVGVRVGPVEFKLKHI